MESIAPPSTRELRGLALYRERGDEIDHPLPNVYIVPGCETGTEYVVHLAPRVRCTCPDFEIRREPCKHIYCAEISAAKSRTRIAS